MKPVTSTEQKVHIQTKTSRKHEWVTALKKELSALGFVAPFLVVFSLFIVIPVIVAAYFAFTYFNTIQPPKFIGLKNFVNLITQDNVFMMHVLPNTFQFALIVGVGGYVLAFLLAWMLAQIPKKPRTILTLAIYSPSMTAGVAMSVVWLIFFSGDRAGYLNSFLIQIGFINEPIQWLQSPEHLMTIMILVSLWNSMGVGFLAMLAGVLNVDRELYEAAYIDGMRNRFQEIWYITIPSMKPQMLFGAVMAVVQTFQAGDIAVQLSGSNPTPQYSGQLILTHIADHGFIRFDMGYASAISLVLLIFVYGISRFCWRLFGEKD